MVSHRWFSMLIEVSGLPSQAECVPIACPIDWGPILEQCGVQGVVDERTLRLFHLDGREEPLQYSPAEQPRFPERHVQPESIQHVSWVGNWDATEVPASLRGSGKMTWFAQGTPTGTRRYRLVWGVPLTGQVVQVPYHPHNLRCFDDQGRPTPVRPFPAMQTRPLWPLDGALHFLRDGACLTSYHTGPEMSEELETGETMPAFRPRRPYFHPVVGPDGMGLTEVGKPHDPTGSHAHHYSLWIAHADVNGHDFWSEQGGLIAHVQFEAMEDGPLFTRVIQRTRWTTGEADVLEERRTLTAYATPDAFRVLDIELALEPSASEPVELGQTPFGFLAARVAQCMTVFDGGGEITNAEGLRNEDGAFGQPSPWIDQSGPISADRWGGVALFDHPSNSRYPTTWHCRNDGWAGSSFNREGPWVIEPGIPLRLRHRVLLHQQDLHGGQVAQRYEEYACHSRVQLRSPQPFEG